MRPRNSAFTIMETMFLVAFFAMGATLAVPIMRWAIVDVHNAQTDAASADCLDRATDALRQDVWQAREIKTPATDRIVLISAVGREITWSLDADGSLQRRELPASNPWALLIQPSPVAQEGQAELNHAASPASNQQWMTFLTGISFTRDGSVLAVRIAASPHHPGSTLSMISPELLYGDQQQ